MCLMQKWTSKSVLRCTLICVVSLALHGPRATGADNQFEIVDFVASAKVSLASAITAAQSVCKNGIPFKAAISRQRPTHAFEVSLLTGEGKVMRVEIDTICSEVLECEEEQYMAAEIRDLRRTVRRARVGLAEAVEAAAKSAGGDAIRGELRAGDKTVTAAIGLLRRGVETEIEIERVPKVINRDSEQFVLNEPDLIIRRKHP